MAQQLITSDPKIMMGKPTVAGTRITVELILEKLAAGETQEQILQAHPRLTLESLRAAIAFASEALRTDVASQMRRPWSPSKAAQFVANWQRRRLRLHCVFGGDCRLSEDGEHLHGFGAA